MLPLTVAAATLNQTPLDWDGNAARIRACVRAARAAGVDVLCLPELCISGYGCEDSFFAAHVAEEAWASLQDLLPETEGMAVSFGLPVRHRGAIYNAACLAVDGRVAGIVAKQHLAGDGLHYEPRWFKPWPAGKQTRHARDGATHPLGDLYFDLGGVRIGFEICEDAWVATRPGAALAGRALDLLLNPSASHFSFGKLSVRQRLIQEGSRAFGVTYVYANLLGNEAGRVIYDGGVQIASAGELVASGPRFGLEEWSFVRAVVDVEHTRTLQARTASFRPAVDDGGTACVYLPRQFPGRGGALAVPTLHRPGDAPGGRPLGGPADAWPASKEEELTRAVTLALHDYQRKSRSRGFVVSLSGGADSAVCACLVRLMVERGLGELGEEAFAARLGLRPPEGRGDAAARWTARLLTTVYQATAQSGAVTQKAAKVVAGALGARHHELDVEAVVRAYVAMVGEAEGRTLDWEHDDIALQNIQARVRAPSAWMFANLHQALLLTTSNRSEAAVGYATMDGDTAGGLAPLGGIDKTFLRRWLRWLETEGPVGLGRVPALAAVNRQAPTAELRPAARAQTDEADLMPYPVLDAIERAAIRDKRSPTECLATLVEAFPELPRAELRAHIRRFFTLWAQNQWKRERYAPSFHLDDESLDPRGWCRFPILSGAYRRELDRLDREG